MSRRIGAAREHRMQQLEGSESLVAAVSAVLYDHDPVGINFESNTDEYDPEAQTIVIRATSSPFPPSVDELIDIVHREFTDWFGSVTAGSRDAYVDVATELRERGLV